MKIVINAPTVSGDHARLSVVDSTLYCEDLVRDARRTNVLRAVDREMDANVVVAIALRSTGKHKRDDSQREKDEERHGVSCAGRLISHFWR